MERFLLLAAALAAAGSVSAQQMEPRAYSPSPVGMNFAGAVYLHSTGDIVLDESSPLQNVEARADSVTPYYGRTFALLGRLAAAQLAAPLVNAWVEGDVSGQHRTRSLTGAGDPLLRFSVNLVGVPAMSAKEFEAREPRTSLGASVIVVAPLGQYDSARLFNLGTNRWSFKPELGLSQPLGRWTLEAYMGAWLFTDNPDWFGGHLKRQEPLLTTQAHVVYSFGTHAWIAGNFAYFTGGESIVSGERSNDRQDNTRAGVTCSVPLTARQSIKLGYARGVTARVGSKFTTLGATWQFAWL